MGRDIKIMGWRPPQRPQWLKDVMKTPGAIRVQLLLLTILTASSVTSTALQICDRARSTSDASTSYKNESLEVVDAGGRVRVTGKHTTEVLRNLQKTGNFWGMEVSKEKSSQSTPQKEE